MKTYSYIHTSYTFLLLPLFIPPPVFFYSPHYNSSWFSSTVFLLTPIASRFVMIRHHSKRIHFSYSHPSSQKHTNTCCPRPFVWCHIRTGWEIRTNRPTQNPNVTPYIRLQGDMNQTEGRQMWGVFFLWLIRGHFHHGAFVLLWQLLAALVLSFPSPLQLL